MTLSEFKDDRRLTLRQMSEMIGIPVATLHGWLTGRRLIGPEHLLRVSRATGGAVTPADLRPDLADLLRNAA